MLEENAPHKKEDGLGDLRLGGNIRVDEEVAKK